MITPIQLRENKIHAGSVAARKSAAQGTVYVARGNDEFAFVPGEDIPYDGATIAAKFYALQAENEALRGEIGKLEQRVNEALTRQNNAIMALAQIVNDGKVL